MEPSKSHQKMAGGRPGGLGLRPPPPTALPPAPTTGAQRPCVKPKLQNLIWSTPPFCFSKFGGFTGDKPYSPPRHRQNLFLMLLTSVDRRGRPARSASESSFDQRGGAAQLGTTPHSSETQALTFSSCSYPNSFYSGPKARRLAQQNQGMGAGRERGLWGRTLHGVRGRSPGELWLLSFPGK